MGLVTMRDMSREYKNEYSLIDKLRCSKDTEGWEWFYDDLLGLYFRSTRDKVLRYTYLWDILPMDNATGLRRKDL